MLFNITFWTSAFWGQSFVASRELFTVPSFGMGNLDQGIVLVSYMVEYCSACSGLKYIIFVANSSYYKIILMIPQANPIGLCCS